MKLITELYEQVNVLTEGVGQAKRYFIEGVFLQADIKNRNERRYPADVMAKEVGRYQRELIAKNRAFGELQHSDSPQINLERVSHIIRSLTREGNNWVGKAEVIDTPMGKIVKALIEAGAQLAASSRGMGTLREVRGIQEVQGDFQLCTAADIVADPSAPDAFVRGIMEGKEWVWQNGILTEKQVAGYKASLEKSKFSTEACANAFAKFMSEISTQEIKSWTRSKHKRSHR